MKLRLSKLILDFFKISKFCKEINPIPIWDISEREAARRTGIEIYFDFNIILWISIKFVSKTMTNLEQELTRSWVHICISEIQNLKITTLFWHGIVILANLKRLQRTMNMTARISSHSRWWRIQLDSLKSSNRKLCFCHVNELLRFDNRINFYVRYLFYYHSKFMGHKVTKQ